MHHVHFPSKNLIFDQQIDFRSENGLGGSLELVLIFDQKIEVVHLGPSGADVVQVVVQKNKISTGIFPVELDTFSCCVVG